MDADYRHTMHFILYTICIVSSFSNKNYMFQMEDYAYPDYDYEEGVEYVDYYEEVGCSIWK